MINKVSGKLSYAVLNFGGLFGIGDDHDPLPKMGRHAAQVWQRHGLVGCSSTSLIHSARVLIP